MRTDPRLPPGVQRHAGSSTEPGRVGVLATGKRMVRSPLIGRRPPVPTLMVLVDVDAAGGPLPLIVARDVEELVRDGWARDLVSVGDPGLAVCGVDSRSGKVSQSLPRPRHGPPLLSHLETSRRAIQELSSSIDVLRVGWQFVRRGDEMMKGFSEIEIPLFQTSLLLQIRLVLACSLAPPTHPIHATWSPATA